MQRLGLRKRLFATAMLCLAALGGVAEARVTRLEFAPPKPAFDGRAFGQAGAYEIIVGVAHGELDPADPAYRAALEEYRRLAREAAQPALVRWTRSRVRRKLARLRR